MFSGQDSAYIHCIGKRHAHSEMPDTKKKKDSQLLIRIPAEDRQEFIRLCDELDTSAAREIRGFIRKYIKRAKRKKKRVVEA